MNPLRPIAGPLRRLHRRTLLHRRPLAALTASGAALAALHATSPPPPETVPVWAARRDLPGGSLLAPTDLTRVRLSPDAVPGSVITDPHDVVGHTLAAPMSRGEPFTSLRLVTKALLRGYPGTTAVPLRITDAAVVPLLRVGDRISLVVADADGQDEPRLLAQDVPVVAIPRAAEAALSGGTPGRMIVAAVPASSATEVAASAAVSIVIPVWTR